MIQRGKDHSGAGGTQRSTPHMTQPNIQASAASGALGLAELQWRELERPFECPLRVKSGPFARPRACPLSASEESKAASLATTGRGHPRLMSRHWGATK